MSLSIFGFSSGIVGRFVVRSHIVRTCTSVRKERRLRWRPCQDTLCSVFPAGIRGAVGPVLSGPGLPRLAIATGLALARWFLKLGPGQSHRWHFPRSADPCYLWTDYPVVQALVPFPNRRNWRRLLHQMQARRPSKLRGLRTQRRLIVSCALSLS